MAVCFHDQAGLLAGDEVALASSPSPDLAPDEIRG